MEDKKRALVVGMAKSGVASARLLLAQGCAVRISDRKSADEVGAALDGLRAEGVEWRLGEKAEDLLEGVDLVVISPGVPIDHPVVRAAKKKGVELIGEMELAARASRGMLVAITGTNGKTTTTMLTGEMFKNAGRVDYVVGNIGDPFADIAARTREEDVVVCEVSSFQLESIDRFHPRVSAILNITEDHLNRHRTMENYILHKAKIFMNQSGDDCLVLNWDDPILRGMAEKAPCRVVWFSRRETPPFGAFVEDDGIMFGTADDKRSVGKVSELRIPGAHNLENALAASAIAMCADVPAAVVRHTLRTFQGVEHRIEFVREVDGVRYINDSKGTNVDSTIKAIDTMARPTVIILGGSDKNVDMTPLCRAISGSQVKHAVLIGQTADQLQATFDKEGMPIYERAGYDFAAALAAARRRAKPGWNVLLSPACASFDMFEDYEERGRVFKKIVADMREGAQ